MYQIDKATNNIIKLEECQFSQLGFKERDHLQEWIVKNPGVIEDGLLVIQKEFSGFDKTNERLDILALDRSGSLVIIENKLDDSGKDLVWQALKYTSYCSTFTPEDIVKVFQEYLDKYQGGGNAMEALLDHYEMESLDELKLNESDQRMIYIANDFRPEVTSTVLWLLDHNVKVQCFKASPYRLGENLFLQIEQIIPVPEAKDFLVSVQKKERIQKEKSESLAKRQVVYQRFWSRLKESLDEHSINFLDKVSAGTNSYIGFTTGPASFFYCISRKRDRVELYMYDDERKNLFYSLSTYRTQIDEKFRGSLNWERKEDGKASKLTYEMPDEIHKVISKDIQDPETWQPRIDWFREAMKEFYEVVYPYWEKAQNDI